MVERSERRLCEEVHLNLAYRWFYRLGLDWLSIRPFDLLEEPSWPFPRRAMCSRRLFETVLQRCIGAGLAGGEVFAVDASFFSIQADVSDRNRVEGVAGPTATGRTVEETQQRDAVAARAQAW
jgi:hypothetical protein